MASLLKWTVEADVIIVGYGGAGAITAIAASDAGAKVLILEKQPADTRAQVKHTPNTGMSGGAWLCPTNEEKALNYLEGMATVANESLTDERKRILSVFAHYLVDNTNWMRKIGVETDTATEIKPILRSVMADKPIFSPDDGVIIADFPELKDSDCACLYFPKAVGNRTHGAALSKKLEENVNQRGIEVLWQTPGEHLIIEKGQVRGVIASHKGKRIVLKARRAVVLTCGGFEFNNEMKENFLRVTPTFFIGNPRILAMA